MGKNGGMGECPILFATLEVFKRAKSNKTPEKYRTNFNDVLKQLIDMAEGKIVPPPDDSGDSPSPATTAGNSIDVTSDTAVMDETSMAGF